ncbi:MAG: hypothetical protein WCK47_14280 [bacterium]
MSDVQVTLNFETPPSGQGNTFTVLCGLSSQVSSVGQFDLDLGYNTGMCSFVSAEQLTGGGGTIEPIPKFRRDWRRQQLPL